VYRYSSREAVFQKELSDSRDSQGEKICKDYNYVYFHKIDDPLTEALNLINNKNCIRISPQYELIYKSSIYPQINNANVFDLVWNKECKNILIKYYNYFPNNIKVIGNIRFKKYAKTERKTKKINIVFMSQNECLDVTDFFIKITKKNINSNIKFYVKMHPQSSAEEIKKYHVNKINIITDLETAFNIADLVISYNSTTLFESVYNNIPILILNPFNFSPPGFPFYRVVKEINDIESMFNFLNKDLENYLNNFKVNNLIKIREFNTDYKL